MIIGFGLTWLSKGYTDPHECSTMAVAPEQSFVDLEAGSEWRFELEGDENIAVRVSHGWEPMLSSIRSPSFSTTRRSRTSFSYV